MQPGTVTAVTANILCLFLWTSLSPRWPGLLTDRAPTNPGLSPVIPRAPPAHLALSFLVLPGWHLDGNFQHGTTCYTCVFSMSYGHSQLSMLTVDLVIPHPNSCPLSIPLATLGTCIAFQCTWEDFHIFSSASLVKGQDHICSLPRSQDTVGGLPLFCHQGTSRVFEADFLRPFPLVLWVGTLGPSGHLCKSLRHCPWRLRVRLVL